MPKPEKMKKIALVALLLGVAFLSANLYFSGTGHRYIANTAFAFAIISDTTFLVTAVLWVLGNAWYKEPERPAGMPGMPMMKMQAPPGAGGMKMQGPPGAPGTRMQAPPMPPQKPNP